MPYLLSAEVPRDTPVLVCDDDRRYPSTLVETLLSYANRPDMQNAIVGTFGVMGPAFDPAYASYSQEDRTNVLPAGIAPLTAPYLLYSQQLLDGRFQSGSHNASEARHRRLGGSGKSGKAHPDSAHTARAAAEPRRVEMLLGTTGYMFRPSVFADMSLFLRVPLSWKPVFWTEDDNYIGCQATLQQVPMFVIPGPFTPLLSFGGGVDGCEFDKGSCLHLLPGVRERFNEATRLQREDCDRAWCDGRAGECVWLYDFKAR
jgi:hypothetical protein